MSASDLETVLDLVVELQTGGCRSLQEIKEHYGVSEPTVKRWLREARHLGIRIAVERPPSGGPPHYIVVNWDDVGARVLKWLELEKEQRELLA